MGLQDVTEDRIDALKSAMVTVMTDRINQSVEKIYKYFDDNMDSVIDDLQNKIMELYQKVAKAQEEGKLEKMTLINAFFMKSEVMEGKLQVKINAYDDDGISKPVDVSVIWYPEFISAQYRADMEYLQKNLDRVLFRPTYRERMIARMLYAEDYYKIVSNILVACGEAFEFVEGIDTIQIGDEVYVSGGLYQEQGKCFYQFQECEVWNSL